MLLRQIDDAVGRLTAASFIADQQSGSRLGQIPGAGGCELQLAFLAQPELEQIARFGFVFGFPLADGQIIKVPGDSDLFPQALGLDVLRFRPQREEGGRVTSPG